MIDMKNSILMQVAVACESTNNIQDAKTFLTIASKHCRDISTLDEIAYVQSELKDYTSCVETLKRCLALTTDPQAIYCVRANLAKTYNHLNDPDSSITLLSMNNKVNPNDYDTAMELAFSYYLKGDYTTSESMMRHTLTNDSLPVNIRERIKYNLGSYDIENGEFKRGVKGFVDVGHQIGIWPCHEIKDIPIWDGNIQPGKTIIIHAEGGIGDELINVRFMRNIEELGMNPVWISNHKSLVDVFTRNGYNAIFQSDAGTIDKSNAVQCMAMYLPILLDLDVDQLWNGAYLTPNKEYLDKWSDILPKGKKLALKWSGNPYYDQNLHRSIPLDVIKDIKYDGIKVSLQLEPELFQDDMFNAGKYINNVEDTLAILWLCDDLISSCTSVIHMNGAIGKNGVVCPPIACYYVWLGSTGTSHWYDSNLKVVRQTIHKNWEFVKTVLDNKV